MSDHTYKRNFIRSVIFRLDFAIPIQSLADGESPIGFQRAVLAQFPTQEEAKTISQQAEFSAGNVSAQRVETKLFKYWDPDRETQVGLGPSFMYLEQSRYLGHVHLFELIRSAVEALFSSWPDVSINRLGLRYVNNIEMPHNGHATDWSRYIQKGLLAAIPTLGDCEELSRYIVSAETRADEYRCRLVWGMPNPDYPAAIRQKQFLVEVDVYAREAIDHQDVYSRLDVFHRVVLRHFEASITQHLREYLDN